MKNKVISLLTSCGYEVNNAGIIFKQSGKTNRKEKAGILNEYSVYFYAQNVAPFKHGTNTFKEILGSEYTAPKYIPAAKTKALAMQSKMAPRIWVSVCAMKMSISTIWLAIKPML